MDLIPTPEAPASAPQAPTPPAPAPLNMNIFKPSRPGLYTFLGVLNAVSFIGILFALGAGLLFLYSFFGRDERGLKVMLAVGVPGLLSLGLVLASTYGFFKMKKYMPILTKVLFAINLFVSVPGLALKATELPPERIGSVLLGLLISGAITYRIHKDRNLFAN